jgi:hypothetical protein
VESSKLRVALAALFGVLALSFSDAASAASRGWIRGPAKAATPVAPHTRSFHHRGSFFVGGAFFYPWWPYGYYYPPPYYYGPDYSQAHYEPPALYVEKFDGTPDAETPGDIFCPAASAYYPDVKDCPNGWQRVIR